MPVASRFNLVIPLEETIDVLVYNTLRGSAALVEPEVARELSSCLPQGGGSKQLFRQFSSATDSVRKCKALALAPESLEQLSSIGAVVESSSVDDIGGQALLSEYWGERTLKLTLAYTAACQLKCTYCFQTGRQGGEAHTPLLMDQTAGWVEQYLSEHSEIEAIYVLLFGGEPLAALSVGQEYINRLRQIAARRNLGFSMGLTTNGIKLTRELACDWASKGLRYVRVTLDGPPSIHDTRRPMASGAGTFNTIVNNLCAIADIDEIGVGISINIDEDNVSHISELLDLLTAAGLSEKVEIILEPTVPVLPSSSAPLATEAAQSPAYCQDVPRLLGAALSEVIAKRFRTPLFTGPYKPCNVVQSHAFVVDWVGRLFKCSFTMSDGAYSIGSIQNGITTAGSELAAVRDVVAFCKDKSCAYLPVCGGGCRYQALWRKGSQDAVNCPLALWDETAPASVAHAFGMKAVRRVGKN